MLLFADLNDILRFDGLAAAATLRVQEAEQLLQAFRVGQIAQESAFPPHCDELLVLQLVQMMGEGGARNVQLGENISHDKTIGVRGKQQAQDAQPRLGPHGLKHIGVANDIAIRRTCAGSHDSTIPEIWNCVYTPNCVDAVLLQRPSSARCERGPAETVANTKSVVRPERLELPTYWFEASRSIQLSYGRARSFRQMRETKPSSTSTSRWWGYLK